MHDITRKNLWIYIIFFCLVIWLILPCNIGAESCGEEHDKRPVKKIDKKIDNETGKKEPVLCTAELLLEINGGNTGGNIPFELEITFSKHIRIDPVSIASIRLRPPGIQKELFEIEFEPYDNLKIIEKNPIKIRGQMRFYSPGIFTIPEITFHYTCESCSGEPLKSVQTKSQTIKIASIVPPDADKPLLMPKDNPEPFFPIEFHHKKAESYLIFSLISFVAAIFGLAWAAGIFYKNRETGSESENINQRKYLEKQIKESLNKTDGLDWKSMTKTGKLLRLFLIESCRITQYSQAGTGEIFFNSIKNKIPSSIAGIIHRILSRIDNAAAQEIETYQESDVFKWEILEIIRVLDNRE